MAGPATPGDDRRTGPTSSRLFAWLPRFRPCRGAPRLGRPARRVRPRLEPLEDRTAPAAYVVANTNDGGPGSLRDAINQVDAGNFNQIDFAIGATGSRQTIAVGSTSTNPLPAVTQSVLIDGWSQGGAGYQDPPLIVLDGSAATSSPGARFGLDLTGNNITVRGLTIDHFGDVGIQIQGGNNRVVADYIGIDPTGTTAAGNGGPGVSITQGASGNTIGGLGAQANVISGNGGAGFFIIGNGTSNSVVEGNFIGTNAAGTAAVANGGDGVDVGASGNTIGGPGGARNVISGNGGVGLVIDGASNNTVADNFIGVAVDGVTALRNAFYGLEINSSPGNLAVGNVISGHSLAVLLSGSATTGNTLSGNHIGVDVSGAVGAGNSGFGVFVQLGANHNTIGGTTVGAGNVIAGNPADGVLITDPGTNANVVEGNFIGVNAAGTAALGNGGAGVLVQAGASGNTIGGVAAGARNIIGGNSRGVEIGDASGNLVSGNYIGVGSDGFTPLGNHGDGVLIVSSSNGANGNTIGGAAGNIISGNSGNGVEILGAQANVVLGNLIGVAQEGATPLANVGAGVLIDSGASGNTIGGVTAADRNVISGNQGAGVVITDGGTNANVVAGDFIGVDASGAFAVANGTGGDIFNGDGVSVSSGAANNTIGGATPGARNVISGNRVAGVGVGRNGAAGPGNVVQGNYLGTDAASASAVPNQFEGVIVNNGSSGEAVLDNVISGNLSDGVQIANAANNTVAGNLIGLAANGMTALGNQRGGVLIFDAGAATTGNVIGGSGAPANVIAGNAADGVRISGAQTTGNAVDGNLIGVAADGVTPRGNGGDGVRIEQGASGNTIGGIAGNVIANNAKGLVVVGDATVGDSILGDSIHDNAGLGIDLGDDGVTPDGTPGPGPNDFQNFPVLTQVTHSGASATVVGFLRGTPGASYTIEFFANAAFDSSGFGQGAVFLGSAQVVADPSSGLATFRFNYIPDPTNPYLTATATSATGDTSEFSGSNRPPVSIGPGPQSTFEDAPLTLTGGPRLSVSDPENLGGDPLTVALTVAHGTLTLGGLAGLAGSGNGTTHLTYTGSQDALNAALATVVYTPDLHFSGADMLTLTTTDFGPPELGGPRSGTATLSVTVVPTAEPPAVAVRDASGVEGSPVPLSLSASLTAQNHVEVLSVQISGVPAAARLSAGVALGNGVWSVTRPQLAGLTLLPDDELTAVLTLTAISTDAVHGRTASTSASFTVAVADVPPTATLTNDGPIDVGAAAGASFVNVTDPSTVDTAAGFRYSFGLDPSELAASYAQAGTSSRQSFTFAQSAGTFTIFGRVFDEDGGFSDSSTMVVVRVVAPTAVLRSGGPTVEGGSAVVSFVNSFDPAATDRAAGFHFAYDLNNDGVFEVGDGTYSGSVAASSVDVPLAFLGRGPGDYTIHGRIIAADGGFTDYRVVVVVLPLQTALDPGPDPIIPPLDDAPAPPPSPRVAAVALLTNVAAALLQSGGTSSSAPAAVEAPRASERAATVASQILPPPLGVVDAARLHSSGGDEATTERKAADQALSVASAILSGDDSVGLVETLLRRPAAKVGKAPVADASPQTGAAPDAEKAPAAGPPAPAARGPARLAGSTWVARLLWPWLAAASPLWFVFRPRSRNGVTQREPSTAAPGGTDDDPRAR
jgi:hypothetical protein